MDLNAEFISPMGFLAAADYHCCGAKFPPIVRCHEINRSLGGFGLGTLLFLHRKAHSVVIKKARPALAEDESKSDSTAPTTPVWQPIQAFLIYRISGGLLFRHGHQHRFGTG
jgi:hypothetical protein